MFTVLQNAYLSHIIQDGPRGIKDLALLSLASRQCHPKLMSWFASHSHQRTDNRWNPRTCMADVKHCNYIGQWQCYGQPTPFVQYLMKTEQREEVCLQCLNQICRTLCHLNEKNIYYVHGNLSVVDIVVEHGKFYIMDNGFPKLEHTTDPYIFYRSTTRDLYTLCLSMREFFDTDSYFYMFLTGYPDDKKFSPKIFQDYLMTHGHANSRYIKGAP